MGRGKAAALESKLGPVELPAGWRGVQWRVENADELAVFLEEHIVRMRRAPGDLMLIQSPGEKGLNLTLYPGDVLVIAPNANDSGERLGVVRSQLAHHFAESETPELILPQH
jgi:hypothetical protein